MEALAIEREMEFFSRQSLMRSARLSLVVAFQRFQSANDLADGVQFFRVQSVDSLWLTRITPPAEGTVELTGSRSPQNTLCIVTSDTTAGQDFDAGLSDFYQLFKDWDSFFRRWRTA